MPKSYRIFPEHNYAYFVTCTIVDWLPIFSEAIYRQIVLDALAYLRLHKRTKLNAFVVMPSHVHAIMWPDVDVNLSDILRDFKRFTSRSISKAATRLKDEKRLAVFSAARSKGRAQNTSRYQVWQEGSHPEAIFSREFAQTKLNYIHRNPIDAGLVESIEDWPYSSARAYYLGEETHPPTDILPL